MIDGVTIKPAPTESYQSLQVLRAIAAAAVVCFHLQPFENIFLPGTRFLTRIVALGDIGVDLFFVISGFIIVTSTKGWFGDQRKALVFLWRRLTRIYPIYWVYCTALLAAYTVNPKIFSGARGPPDIFASFLLYPSHGASLLLVSWTLTFELQFYLLFTVALFVLPERRLPVALCTWAVIIVARNLFIERSFGLANLPFDLLNLDFVAGCLVARFACSVSRAVGLFSFLAGLALLIGGCIIFSQQDGTIQKGWPGVMVGGGSSALILLAAIVWESRIRAIIPRILIRLGDSSYSLYLSHLLTFALVGRVWQAILPRSSPFNHIMALGAAFTTSLLVGQLSYRLMEQPLLWLSRRLTRSLKKPNPLPRGN